MIRSGAQSGGIPRSQGSLPGAVLARAGATTAGRANTRAISGTTLSSEALPRQARIPGTRAQEAAGTLPDFGRVGATR